MTEFLIIIGVVDILVFGALYSVMKAGRAADRTSEAQARALWASSERVRRETPLGGYGAQPGLTGRKVVDSHGSMLGVAGQLLSDPLDGGSRWLEVQVRGLGNNRWSLVPADGMRATGTEVRVAFSRDLVLHSPPVPPGPLTRDGELALARHFGLGRRVGELYSRAPGEPTAVPATQLGTASVA